MQCYGLLHDVQKSTAYIVLEYVEGMDLSKRIHNIPEDQKQSIAEELGDAIAYMHSKGWVHRDLKPSNIRLTSPKYLGHVGTIKVFDFGLAIKLWDTKKYEETELAALKESGQSGLLHEFHGLQSNSEESRTMTGGIGTPSYMAPELIAKRCVYSFSVDVWAFGVTLFELFSRQDARDRLGVRPEGPVQFWRILLTGKSTQWPQTDQTNCINSNLREKRQSLVNSILTNEVKNRPTMTQVMQKIKARPQTASTSPAGSKIALDVDESVSGVGEVSSPGHRHAFCVHKERLNTRIHFPQEGVNTYIHFRRRTV